MKSEVFSDFNLVGGTSLSLQIGHRLSIDIDMFGNAEIDEIEFINELSKFGKVIIIKKSKNILITSIDGIKVDFVNYKYPLLEPIIVEKNIRLVSKKDIAAMKLNAVSGRGSKKDFIDLFFLLKDFELKEMLTFYDEKFKDGSSFMVLKSLSYFEDANKEEAPIMLVKNSWEEIKEKIINELDEI
ncbi:nucleotidyl transferase AbiEii/AbiGii toxin family protein [Flavobacterium sp.]|uniref:nucleotidyl transferase AbiEii/AbiGii toxin family protein n=1 Tax=Flavobacterium sp. TaxID=239 RepID=UPI0037528383